MPVIDERVRKIDPERPAADRVSEAVRIIDASGLLVAPTETRYGLLTRADNKIPAERLAHAKRRAATKPVSVFVGSIAMIEHFGRLSVTSSRLARLFLPGPLTLVVPAIGTWHPMIVPHDRIGIRVSSSPVIQAIMENVGYPVTATSANISGDEENECIDQIVDAFRDDVDLYLDGGRLTGMPSTVVDCTTDPPRILREGAVDPEEIERAIRE